MKPNVALMRIEFPIGAAIAAGKPFEYEWIASSISAMFYEIISLILLSIYYITIISSHFLFQPGLCTKII